MINGMTTSLTLEDPILTHVARLRESGAGDNDPFFQTVTPFPSGAIPLFPLGFFPWGGLPYPHLHAQLGIDLLELKQYALASAVGRFHQLICDHSLQPILSLFCQEGRIASTQLQRVTATLLDRIETPPLPLPCIDEELGIWRDGDAETTVVVTATGCQTGLGAFLHGDAGVISFGPQLSPIGDCRGYGIAGRAQILYPSDLEHWNCGVAKAPGLNDCKSPHITNIEQFEIIQSQELSLKPKSNCSSHLGTHQEHVSRCRYRTRLGATHQRQTGLPFLADSEYRGLWVQVSHQISAHHLETTAYLEGPGLQNAITWVVFGRAACCVVAGSHRLAPNSLDRYQGPIQEVKMRGKEGSVAIHSTSEGKMEVIPLAGDDSFWGANFLVVFKPTLPQMNWTFRRCK